MEAKGKKNTSVMKIKTVTPLQMEVENKVTLIVMKIQVVDPTTEKWGPKTKH